MTAEPRPHPLENRTLGEFVLREVIGEGGFGQVFRAEQPLLNREAVVKVLHTEHGGKAAATQRFLREARLASRLDHPYAAHVYAFGAEADGTLWIAMEHVRGATLDAFERAHGPMALEKFVPLLERICEVVHTAHEQGIVHRDLKPSNVMVVSRAGRLLPKLLDFGIAKFEGAGAPVGSKDSLSRVQDMLGSWSPVMRPRGLDPSTNEHVTPILPVVEGPSSQQPGTTSLAPEPTHSERLAQLEPAELHELMSRSVSGEITAQTGQLVGSPHFLAPEQWLNASSANPRADIYALGILAYRVLMGAVPFAGADLMALAFAHARTPLPSVAPKLPVELDAVLRRATAKDPEERFQTALEFAAAFRSASGLDDTGAGLPCFDEALLKNFVQEAPRPIAEAASLVEAAGNLRQAWRAARGLVRVTLRYVATLALAARARPGGTAGADGPEVLELLARTAEGPIQDEEWLALAQGLVQPFRDREELYPIPELIPLLLPDRAGRDSFSDVLALCAAAAERRGANDDGTEAELSSLHAALRALLLRLSFLSEYQLVVGRSPDGDLGAGGDVLALEVDRWMGTRRSSQPTLRLRKAVVAGRPLLVDANGVPALSLWPLAQVAEPSPTAPVELFLFAGKGRFGARLEAVPSEFERQDEEVLHWYEQTFLEGRPTHRAGLEADATPYKALSAFTAGDAQNFFGREREAEAFVNRLRVMPLLAVVGASGAGKSSFVQAGVLPLVPAAWVPLVMRPGATPLLTLLARFRESGFVLDSSADGAGLRRVVEAELLRRGPEATLLLVVDQFEEVLTLCRGAEERRAFASTLVQLVQGSQPRVRIILTLRDDFLMRVQQLPELRERIATGLQLLSTPAPEDLLRIVSEPARRLGYGFEPTELPSRMVEAVSDQPGALALLSFTASKLWALRDQGFKQLTGRAYESLGGVGGALAQHAEATLDELGPEQHACVREAFRHLVTADGTRAVLTRAELEQVLGSKESSNVVLERLVAARLLVMTEGSTDGAERVEVTHEALLTAWPRLVKWRHEDQETLRFRDDLRAASRAWEAKGQPRALLWRGELLTEFKLWRARYRGQLTEAEEAFTRQGMELALRGRRGRAAALIGSFVALLVGVGVLYAMNTKAHARLLELYEEQGRQALANADPMRALVYLGEAYRQGARTPSLRFMLARGWQGLGGSVHVLRGHTQVVKLALFSPDDGVVLTGGDDGLAQRIDARTGRVLGSVHLAAGGVGHGAFLGASNRFVLASRQTGRPELFDGEGSTARITLAGPPEQFGALAVTPDGRTLVTGGSDGKVRLWNAQTGRLQHTLEGHTATVAYLAVSPDGAFILSGSRDGTARVWNTARAAEVSVLRGHKEVVWRGDISADDAHVVTGSDDTTVRVWNLRTGAEERVFRKHSGHISAVALAPDGKTLLTASEDGTARWFDLASGEERLVIVGAGPMLTAAFSPRGERFAVSGWDGAIRMHDARTGEPLWTFMGHLDGISALAFSHDGRFIASASADHTARVWDALHLGHLASFSAGEPLLATTQVSPKGPFLSLGLGSVHVWSAQGGAPTWKWPRPQAGSPDAPGSVGMTPDAKTFLLPRGVQVELRDFETRALRGVLSGHGGDVNTVAVSPDGRRALTTAMDRSAKLWKLDTRQVLATWTQPDPVWLGSFSPDGSLVATPSQDGSVQVRSAADGTLRLQLSAHASSANSARFSPDGARLLTASDDRTLRMFDVRTGALQVTFHEQSAPLYDALFGPDGSVVFSAGMDGFVRAWSATGKLLGTVGRHQGPVTSLSLVDGGRTLVSSSVDGLARLWDVSTFEGTTAVFDQRARCSLAFQMVNDQWVERSTRAGDCSP